MSELFGIINNSLQRGWPLQEIYQSLINSGYNPQEIQMEISKFSPQNNVMPLQPSQSMGQKLSTFQMAPVSEKKTKNKWILFSVLSVLIVLLALIIFFLFK